MLVGFPRRIGNLRRGSACLWEWTEGFCSDLSMEVKAELVCGCARVVPLDLHKLGL